MKRRNEVLVGLLTVVAIAIGVVGSLWLARGGLDSGYRLYADFPWGAGLKQGQPVLLVGVNVGFVERVELKPEGRLIATLNIKDEFKVPQGTTAAVEPNGIFGDMLVALRPVAPNPRSIAAGDTVPIGKSAPGTAELLTRADSIARDVQAITLTLNREMTTNGGIADIRATIASLNRVSGQLETVVARQSRAIDATLASVRRSAAALDSATIDSTMRNVRTTSASVERMTRDLERTSARLNSVLAKVDTGNGTAAKLVNDPELYNDVRRLTMRVDSLLVDFKKNPRRYINLEIF